MILAFILFLLIILGMYNIFLMLIITSKKEILKRPVIIKETRVTVIIGKIMLSLLENSMTTIEIEKVLFKLPINAPVPHNAYKLGFMFLKKVAFKISPYNLPIIAPIVSPKVYVPNGIAAVVKHQNM